MKELTMATTSQNLNSGTLNRDGFLLQYKIEGKGHPAIVIGSINQYPPTFSDDLRNHLQLIFIDHRGLVTVPKGLEQAVFELDTILEDIEAIRQILNLDRIIVIGHSGHAYMALEYAKKYPTHVSHVVMIAISPSLNVDHKQAAHFYWQDFASSERKEAHENHLKQCPDETLLHLSPGDRFVKEYIRNGAKIWYDFETNGELLWREVPVNAVILNYIWSTVFGNIDITKGLSEFNIPVFLALGLYDFAIAPFTAWYPIREQFRNFTMSLFEKSGHVPQLEEAVLFDKRLLKWINEN